MSSRQSTLDADGCRNAIRRRPYVCMEGALSLISRRHYCCDRPTVPIVISMFRVVGLLLHGRSSVKSGILSLSAVCIPV